MSEITNDGLFTGLILVFGMQSLTIMAVALSMDYYATVALTALFCIFAVSIVFTRIGPGYNRAFWNRVYPDFVPEDNA